MALFRKTNRVLQRLKRDESGTMAIAWAMSITAALGVIGAGIDFSLLAHADSRSQNIADTTALAAAIFVKNNERIPNDRNEGLKGLYTAAELGYSFEDWVVGGAAGVDINIVYDNDKREATVTVSGQTKPKIMQLLGQGNLDFGSESVVKYQEQELLDPASIVLILDNSGSMHFDDTPLDADGNRPDGTQPRIDGLEKSTEDMMAFLHDTVGPQDPDGNTPAVLRTGMLPFSDRIITATDVPMKWGRLSATEITDMEPDGATDSSVPLVEANRLLELEHTFHTPETPGKTPLKFIVLMTDGQNTEGDEEWVARAGTENWRRYVTGRPTDDGLVDAVPSTTQVTPEICQTDFETSWVLECSLSDSLGNHWTEILGPYDSRPNNDSGSYDIQVGGNGGNGMGMGMGMGGSTQTVTVTYNCNAQDRISESETCTPAQYDTTWSGWEYEEGEFEPPLGSDGPWQEGEFDIESNIQTRAECDALHAKNVEIYTVAYALEPGDYRTNDWGVDNNLPGGADYPFETTAENAAKARGILQYCASDDDNFITANDTASLTDAFKRIGNDIVKEIVRISS